MKVFGKMRSEKEEDVSPSCCNLQFAVLKDIVGALQRRFSPLAPSSLRKNNNQTSENAMKRLNLSALMTVSIIGLIAVSPGIAEALPDLVVTSLTIDTNPIVQPDSTTIRWTIKNEGDSDAIPVNHWLRIVLSNDSNYHDTSKYVAGRKITVNLGPQQEYSGTFNFNSGDYSTGNFYLVAKVDATEIVTESSENNNTRSLPITIEEFHGYSVRGYVLYSNGKGFGGVNVNLTGNGKNLTDSTQNDGYYHFDGLGDGTYSVAASKSGWAFTNSPQTAIVSGSNVWLADMVGSPVPDETISKPGQPIGETSPAMGTNYTYTTSGATSSLGHTVEYQFNWGDSTTSVWSTSKSANHAWTSTGTRAIKVTARCKIHTDKTNTSDPLQVTVVTPAETISKPGQPTGQTNPIVALTYTYSTSGATSSLGHTIEYRFNWGDGTTSAWSTSKSASHAWTTTGTRTITVTARCQIHTDKTNTSDPLQITVVPEEPPPPAKKRLIIDTDPAVGDSDPDDGTAIIYAFQSPKLCTIEGITYGYGNFGHQIPEPDGITRGSNRMLDYYLLQLNKMLEVLREDGAIENSPPLYRGHKESETWDNNESHPQTGASDFIRETVRDNPGQITVVALGTLTNIATAMANYPNGQPSDPNGFMRDCKELWIIGGAIILKDGSDLLTGNVIDCDGVGNCAYTLAEWNIWRDKKATEYVLRHAITDPISGEPKIKLVPLNASMRPLIKNTDIEEVKNSNTMIANYLDFPLRWWINEVNPLDNRQSELIENFKIAFARLWNSTIGGHAFPPYDTIGMALALEPDIATWQENHKVYVSLSPHNAGQTIEDDTLSDREEVHVFYDYNEPNMTSKIVARWSEKLHHQPPANKKFIECSDADYVVRYYDSGYKYSEPKNVTEDADLLGQYYYHLPVGVHPYTYNVLSEDPVAMYRGRMTFDIDLDIDLPSQISVSEVKLHIYCDKKKDWFDTGHRVSIYDCNPQENDAVRFWNSATETNKYVGNTHIGTLQAWRTVNLGSKAVSKLQNVAGGGQFAILLAEDGDDHPCAWFDTSKDWKAYLEVGIFEHPLPPSKATNPSPSNGAASQSIDVELSWSDGSGATSYDVYFGTTSTPDSGEFRGNQTGTTYGPGTLSYNTTYYWRIDAKNPAGTTTGDVWSFATESAPPSLPSKPVNPSPSNDATNQSITADLNWSDGGGASSYDVYFGTTFTPDSGEFQGNQAETTYNPGTLSYNTTYYWRINARNSTGITTGDIWSFATESAPPSLPTKPVNPSPINGATNQSITADLNWSDGGGASSYDVYFGTTSTPDSGEFQGNQAETTYNPGTLSYNTTYYWRINARNSTGITTGDIWSFTTKADGEGTYEVINLTQLTDGPIQESEPTFNVDGTKIAYRNLHEPYSWDNCDIWVMNVDGSGKTQITTDSRGEFGPSFVPDGRITYTKEFGSNDYDIWMVNADGSNPHSFISGSYRQTSCRWHPIGNKLVYCSEYQWAGPSEIWTANADGTDRTPLTDHTVDGYGQAYPVYSRSGNPIAYANGAKDGEQAHIWIMNADGSAKHQITFGAADQNPMFWWPDDSSIGYTQNGELWLHHLSTGADELLLSVSGGNIGWADLSADGIRLVFDLSDASGTHIWIGDVTVIHPDIGAIGDFCGANGGPPDGYVDVWDLMQFADQWHTSNGDFNWDSKFDLTGPNFEDPDGYTDVWDLMVFADHWHEGVKP